MKKSAILSLFILMIGLTAFAQDSGLGVGVILGEPTGISMKLWLNKESAIDLGVAYSFIDSQNSENNDFHIQIHADYLFHFYPDIMEIPRGSFAFYCGIGSNVVIYRTGLSVGFRIPLGITFLFQEVPIDIFLEIVPGLQLFPETAFRANGGIGVRWFFR